MCGAKARRTTSRRGQAQAGESRCSVPSLAGGGAERALLEIARGLTRRGFAVDLAVTRSGGALWGAVSEDVRLIDLKSWKTPTCLPALVRYIGRERPALLVSALELGRVNTNRVRQESGGQGRRHRAMR